MPSALRPTCFVVRTDEIFVLPQRIRQLPTCLAQWQALPSDIILLLEMTLVKSMRQHLLDYLVIGHSHSRRCSGTFLGSNLTSSCDIPSTYSHEKTDGILTY